MVADLLAEVKIKRAKRREGGTRTFWESVGDTGQVREGSAWEVGSGAGESDQGEPESQIPQN